MICEICLLFKRKSKKIKFEMKTFLTYLLYSISIGSLVFCEYFLLKPHVSNFKQINNNKIQYMYQILIIQN